MLELQFSPNHPRFPGALYPNVIERETTGTDPPLTSFETQRCVDDISGNEVGNYDLDLVPTSRKGEFNTDLPCGLHHTNW